MDDAGSMTERITLQRLDNATNTWSDLADTPVWAAVESQGEDRYRIRIRDRADLRRKADIAPAVRAKWIDGSVTRYLQLDDVTEAERRTETHLIAHQVLVEFENLAAGVTEIKAWP